MFQATICLSIFHRPKECLTLVLESILKDPIDHKTLELAVCDDCCPAPAQEIEAIIQKYAHHFGKTSYHRHDERDGFRKTFLQAKVLEEADSEVFIFLDGDCVITGQALSVLIQAAKDNRALAQGYRSYLHHSCIDWAIDNLDAIDDYALLKEKFGINNTKNRKETRRRRALRKNCARKAAGLADLASGYFMGIRTAEMKDLGIVSKINKGYYEDTYIAERFFAEKSIDVMHVPHTEVLHVFEHH